MPGHAFFRSFGLFTRPAFLNLKECAELRNVADHSKGEAAKVYSDGKEILREEYRKTLQAPLIGEAGDRVNEKIEALRPELEKLLRSDSGQALRDALLDLPPRRFFRASHRLDS